MNSTVNITADTFDDVVSSETPTLVDFWADWCGPCQAVTPTLEEIASEKGDRLTVAKLNVDEHPAIAQEYGVMSIPTLILFVDGVEKKRLVGAQPKSAIEGELAEFVA